MNEKTTACPTLPLESKVLRARLRNPHRRRPATEMLRSDETSRTDAHSPGPCRGWRALLVGRGSRRGRVEAEVGEEELEGRGSCAPADVEAAVGEHGKKICYRRANRVSCVRKSCGGERERDGPRGRQDALSSCRGG